MTTNTVTKRPSSRKRLPAKPSALLELALGDLEACEQDPHYQISMDCWHLPAKLDDIDYSHQFVCKVCLAGATLAKTLKSHPLDEVFPAAQDRPTANKLYAVDDLRTGHIGEAFDQLGRPKPATVPNYVTVARYEENPRKFKKDIRKIIRILRKAGV